MAFKAKLPLLLFFFGSFLLTFTSSLAYEKDPEQQLQQCTSFCEKQEKFQDYCKEKCVEQYVEQKKEQERHSEGRHDEPRMEYQQCQRRCQQQEKESQQQQCQQRCEEKLKEHEIEEGRRGDDRADPQREYQQCQRRCEQQDRRSQQQCQHRCEEKLREQEREERRIGDNKASPQREYQQCKRRCQQQERGSQQQCQQRCDEKLREQEREERRDRDNKASPQQCQRRCQEQEKESQQQCQQRCEEKLREQEREERRDRDNKADPQREYQQCQKRCQEQESESQQQQCQHRCEEKLREQERQEQRRGDNNGDSQREYQQCESRCQEQERGQQQQCQERCEERRRQQEREEGQQQQQGRNNPYFFDEQSFIEKYRTEEGRIRVLPKFTQRSNLHRGIENYRLAIFEANPNTFVIPNHGDADAVLYVVKGRGTISMIRKQNRDSFNLERGDVIRVPSGSVVYMVNRDNNEQLQIAKLYQPISTTGHVHEFFGVGAEEPESYYRTFSNEILEAALNTPIDQLERLFGQQKKGVIIRASKEQVQALSKQASSSSKASHLWPRGGGSESRGPYNILNEKPTYSNNHGELYEVKPNEYKQLQDLDIAVSFVNITKGAMMAPYYNTRATKLILVVEGRGRFEMACPHLARQSQQHSQRRGEQEQEQEQGGAQYQRVGARLSPKTMFIVPTGHPVAIIASDNENLELVAFTINAQDSQRNFLAGKENVVNQMEKEAIELGFNMPSKEVQEIYNRQKESVFVPGPNQRQDQRERGSHGLSILDFVNF